MVDAGAAAASVRAARPPVTFISWAPYCSRSDNIAREMEGVSHMVYLPSLGSNPATVWLKYLGQAARTFRLLRRDKPQAVFVMAPPIIAAMPAWLYGKLTGTPYVIDAHTAAFLHPRWRRLQWLQRAISRGAATTIVTNDHLAQDLRAAGAHVTIVRDVPVQFPALEPFPRDDRFTVAAICSFNDDEPVAEIFQAARQVPEVRFFVTGNAKRLSPALLGQVPPNMTLTGFIPDAQYGHLVTNADVILTLTTRNHTMLRGAYEAIYQGTPVIVSDWPLLRSAFDQGAIHVDNSAGAIAAAVRTMAGDYARFKADAAGLRARKLSEWNQARASLRARLGRSEALHPSVS